MLDSIQDGYERLLSADPYQALRLRILLEALAALNPEGAEKMLGVISSALERLGSIGKSANAAHAPTSPLASPPAPAPAEQTVTEVVRFELDFEMEMSSDVSQVLARLRDQGIHVRAARIESSRKVSIHIEFTGIRQEVRKADPLVLDLAGDGIALSSIEDGADFDINGDGRVDRTAFVRGDDAFLALDLNGNGRIDDGTELFGDQNGALNGFEELARYDDNGDGIIDARDAVFASLRLLHDKNGDGRVEPHEVSTLAEHNIRSLSLRYYQRAQDDAHGNTLAEHGFFTRDDGMQGALANAWLSFRG